MSKAKQKATENAILMNREALTEGHTTGFYPGGSIMKVLNIGSMNLDYVYNVDHIVLPGETEASFGLNVHLGGKGMNQAVACKKFGADTVFISAIGRDANGQACKEEAQRFGITAHWIEKDEPTAFGVITTDRNGENTVNVYGGAAHALTASDVRHSQIYSYMQNSDYVLMQNEFPAEVLIELAKMAEELSKPLIWNPAPAKEIPLELLSKAALITPNCGEAKVLAGFAQEEKPSDEEFETAFRNKGIKSAVITMGNKSISYPPCRLSDGW